MHEGTHSTEGELAAQKRRLRDRFREAVASIPPEERAHRSEAVCERVMAAPFFVAARSVMLYAPIPGEVDIAPLLTLCLVSGRKVAISRVDWAAKRLTPALVTDPGTDLIAGHRGVREPAPGLPEFPPVEIDLVVAPGLAFDLYGVRLGRGGGFYDRFLARPELRATICGVAFEAQVTERLPAGPHDARVHAIVTEDRMIRV